MKIAFVNNNIYDIIVLVNNMTKKKNTTKSNKKSKNVQTRKEVLNNSIYESDTSNVIKCVVIVLVILLVMYLLTVLILKKSSTDYISKEDEKTAIQYSEILAGTSFNKEDEEYLVLFYDTTADNASVYGNMISTYEAKDSHLPIYYVNLANTMNKSINSSESNKDAKDASELKINQSTLIKFSNGGIVDYIEGKDSINEYLK